MTYRVTRHDNTRISIELNDQPAYVLEREAEGRGFWALFPIHGVARGARITTDQYSNDLIEWATSGFIRGGHLARVAGGFVVPVPVDAGDFYVSGTGYLCCRNPVRMVLTEKPVTDVSVRPYGLRPATLEEREAAGLNIHDATQSGVFFAAAE